MKTVHALSQADFIAQASGHAAALIKAAIADHGSAVVGLSGGSTPGPIYKTLSLHTDIDWSAVGVFLLDERYIGADDKESNQRMIRETLLTGSAASATAVFPNTALPIDACIVDYVQRVKKLWGDRLPDLAVLGMGDDGHIASLFPPLPPIALTEERFALHTTTDRFAVRDRISVSLNVVACAQAHMFLLSGQKKAEVWSAMLSSPEGDERWPAKRIIHSGTNVCVFQA